VTLCGGNVKGCFPGWVQGVSIHSSIDQSSNLVKIAKKGIMSQRGFKIFNLHRGQRDTGTCHQVNNCLVAMDNSIHQRLVAPSVLRVEPRPATHQERDSLASSLATGEMKCGSSV
jgi:hypothetical protein